MLRTTSFLILFFASSAALASPMKVFILAGQSNAGGGMSPALAPPPLNAPQNSRFQYRIQSTATANAESADWEALHAIAGPAGWGTELSFGKAMEQRTGAPVAIIKVAASATALWKDWLPTADNSYAGWTPENPHPNLYQWMLAKVNSSLTQLGALGYEPDVSGFLWIQGEADANLLDKSLAYDDNLATLASALRTDLSEPDLPFLLNQAHVGLNRPLSSLTALRESQQNAANSDPNMYLVNFDDLALGGDNIHWTPATHVELGRRFADVLIPSGDFNDDGLVNGDDLPVWEAGYGVNRTGDGNADGVANGSDFLLWQRQLGNSPANPVAATIPEPSGLVLLAATLSAFSVTRRASRRA